MVSTKSKIEKVKKQKVPDYLVYEIMDGKPIYYKGYQEVLKKKKTLDDIIGCSSLQSVLIEYILGICFANLDRSKYRFLTNEIGNHLDKGNNLSSDIAIYDKTVLTPDKINLHYPDVPAKILMEVDTKADLSEVGAAAYFHKKTQKLLNFGVEKVIWIFTASQKITISERNASAWKTVDWDQDIELLEGHFFNIAKYLEAEGIKIEEN